MLAAFALLSLLAVGLGAGAPEERSLRRLHRHAAPREIRRRPPRTGALAQVVGVDRRDVFLRLDRRLVRWRAGAGLDRRLREAGLVCSPSSALLTTAGAAVLCGVVAATLGGPAAGAGGAAACAGAAWRGLDLVRVRRISRLERQLPAALDLLVAQLRAHRSVVEAITDLTRQIPAPLRAEVAWAAEDLRLGATLEEALGDLTRRVPSRPLATAVTAITVADRTGAHLAEFLARQSAAVRAQVAFGQEVRALTAHARSSAALLTVLPIGIAAALLVLDPGVFAPMLRSQTGRALLATAALMELMGWQIIRAMIRRVER